MVEVIDEHGEMAYPLAVAIEDLAISVLSLPSGQRAALEVVAPTSSTSSPMRPPIAPAAR